jgi:hypothetical protein
VCLCAIRNPQYRRGQGSNMGCRAIGEILYSIIPMCCQVLHFFYISRHCFHVTVSHVELHVSTSRIALKSLHLCYGIFYDTLNIVINVKTLKIITIVALYGNL